MLAFERTVAQVPYNKDEVSNVVAMKAKERKLAGKPIDPEEKFPQGWGPQTRDMVAQTIGLGSGKQWDKLHFIGEHQPQLLPKIAPSGITTSLLPIEAY